MSFNWSYLIAAAIITALTAWYGSSGIGRPDRGLLIGFVMALLYAFLFLTLNQEDYALISGTALSLAALIALMASTRKINREPEDDSTSETKK
jgi:inner membrane protein